MTQGFRGSHKHEGASDHWPSAPFVRYAAGGTATQFLAVRGTYSAREGHPSAPSQVHVSHEPREKSVPPLTPTQIKIIWMLLSICGTPMTTLSMIGMSSEKLDIHNLEYHRSLLRRTVTHLPAGRRYKIVFFRLSYTRRPVNPVN